GDLPAFQEKKLAVQLSNHNFKGFKCGHHGSKTSTPTEFVKAIKPEIGFISAGWNGSYKLPRKETFDHIVEARNVYPQVGKRIYMTGGYMLSGILKKYSPHAVLAGDAWPLRVNDEKFNKTDRTGTVSMYFRPTPNSVASHSCAVSYQQHTLDQTDTF
ncbi:MAG: hypothetical protein AAF585_02435, partial [Verrucomicrobiota bacterium]